MYLLYSILLVVWGLLLIPVFLYKAWRHHKYLPGLAQRLGRLPEGLRFDGRDTIWFHSCSVGETLSLQPLAQYLHGRFPESRFLFSTITKTGQEMAVQRFALYGKENTFYFPVDLASIAGRVLDLIRPTMLIIIDTEIWPNILRQARRRGIPVVLANGRISAASFRHYRWARPAMRRIFRDYKILMMQSQEDADRIAEIGAPPEKILVTGNMKFDKEVVEKESGAALTRDIQPGFGLGDSNSPLIIAGSTHPGEEQILLQVLQRIRLTPELKQTRLLLAPRHPERFDAVAELAARSGFEVRRRTQGGGSAENAAVFLLDTLGELAAVYRFATIVFVGGTLVGHGGHSILEPALYAKAIVVGPSMDNFRRILEEFRGHNGIRQIRAGEGERSLQVQQLLDVFLQLLQNDKEREALGTAAFSILEKNRGAALRSGEKIAALFEEARTKTGDLDGNEGTHP
jgi:3-deoxy-D-manno-octulosonic-acid transferase